MRHRITASIQQYANSPIAITLEDKDYIIHKIRERFVLYGRWCPHASGDLLKAKASGTALTCPNHGLCFDLDSGNLLVDDLDEELAENVNNKGVLDLRITIFEATNENNEWFVEL